MKTFFIVVVLLYTSTGFSDNQFHELDCNNGVKNMILNSDRYSLEVVEVGASKLEDHIIADGLYWIDHSTLFTIRPSGAGAPSNLVSASVNEFVGDRKHFRFDLIVSDGPDFSIEFNLNQCKIEPGLSKVNPFDTLTCNNGVSRASVSVTKKNLHIVNSKNRQFDIISGKLSLTDPTFVLYAPSGRFNGNGNFELYHETDSSGHGQYRVHYLPYGVATARPDLTFNDNQCKPH